MLLGIADPVRPDRACVDVELRTGRLAGLSGLPCSGSRYRSAAAPGEESRSKLS